MSFLYEEIAKAIEKYSYKTFSTIEAGQEWLKQGIYYSNKS